MTTRARLLRLLLLPVLCTLVRCDVPSDPATPEYWISRLDDKREQEEAVKKLGELKDKKAVDPLIKVMKENDKLRPAAAQALGTIGDPKAIPELMAIVTVDPGALNDDATRQKQLTTERAINALGDLKAKEAADLILQVSQKARDLPTRMAVLRAMGSIKDPKFGPAMLQVLDDDSESMPAKKAAVEVLGEMRDPAAVPGLIAAMYTEKAGGTVYPQAALALYKVGAPAVAPLIQTLEGKNDRVQKLAAEKSFVEGAVAIKALEVLADLGGDAKQAEDAMIAAWEIKNEDTRPYVRRGVALALGTVGSKKAVAHLTKALDEPSGELRQFYTEALNELSDRSALPALLKAAKKGTDIGKRSCIVAYTRLGEASDAAAAKAAVKGAADLQPELARLDAAAECKGAVDCWIGKLKDKDARVRDRAAYSLGRIGDKKAAEALVAALKDPNLETRYAIIWALRRVGSKAQVEALKAIAASERGLPTHRGNGYLQKLIIGLER
ncbi:MAG: HEAT repeat domain-containing protein [Deltaproteobacteria bacterium]|nr:HEAT repeat domain-containing protein [Deltaproteobacteria bacterium]